MPLSDKECIQFNQALFTLAPAYETRMQKDEAQLNSGLALSDRAVIMVLGQFAPINSRQLSKYMDLNPGTISLYVQRLVEKGIVKQERDKKDRRNWWLNLTSSGQDAYQETIFGTVLYTRDFLSALDETEQHTLLELLIKASHSLGFNWQ